jgi:hypothetical protein
MLTLPPHLARSGKDVSKQEKKQTNITKLRTDLHFISGLTVAGFFTDIKVFYP